MLAQITDIETAQTNEFAKDVLQGLLAKEKYLSSKYFYDEEGSKIFQRIMQLEEYYLTRCEEGIFKNYSSRLFELFTSLTNNVSIIELGAGDGTKTKLLLKVFLENNFSFTYSAIDISEEALSELSHTMHQLVGAPPVLIQGEYLESLKKIVKQDSCRNVVLFLGSNIGNFNAEQSHIFLSEIRRMLNTDDLFLIGFDLQKDPQIILNAYNDAAGVTKEFNLNLLQRINVAFDANFDLEKFDHVPVYDQESGEARSYIKSKVRQTVYLRSLSKQVIFEEGECLHTEISRKYTLEQISKMAIASGFQIAGDFQDNKKYFCNSVWKAV